jgi:hypothetical protein
MDIRRGELPKLRDPAADVGSVWVELFCLEHRIEDAEIGRGVRA